MKILFHFTMTLFVLNLVACNQTKSPEPIKQYTFIGGKEGDKIDTTSFDSLQLSDPLSWPMKKHRCIIWLEVAVVYGKVQI